MISMIGLYQRTHWDDCIEEDATRPIIIWTDMDSFRRWWKEQKIHIIRVWTKEIPGTMRSLYNHTNLYTAYLGGELQQYGIAENTGLPLETVTGMYFHIDVYDSKSNVEEFIASQKRILQRLDLELGPVYVFD